jgi:hypothetical protein
MFKKFLFLSILFLSFFSLFSKTEKTQNEEEKSMFTEEIEVVGKMSLFLNLKILKNSNLTI